MPENKEENSNNKEVVHPVEGNVDNSQTTEQKSSTESRPDSQEKNWKEVREIIQQQRQEITDLRQQLDNKQNQSQKEQDPLAELAEDDVLTVSDAKKLASNIAKQTAMEIVKEREKNFAYEQVPNQYNDFHDVIKYIDEIVKDNPALETAILKSPNPRLTAYQIVKSSHIYQRAQASNNISPDAQKAMENTKKPLSSQAVGTTSPLNDIKKYEKMTPEKARKIRKLVEEYASKRI